MFAIHQITQSKKMVYKLSAVRRCFIRHRWIRFGHASLDILSKHHDNGHFGACSATAANV